MPVVRRIPLGRSLYSGQNTPLNGVDKYKATGSGLFEGCIPEGTAIANTSQGKICK